MRENKKQHWFLFSYQAGGSQCNVSVGINSPMITNPVLKEVQDSISYNCDGAWVLMNISSLGYMTTKEFHGNGEEEA